MKVIRLPSGPLACVYAADDAEDPRGSGSSSGTFTAFSGSVEAEGSSEEEALDALDQTVRRLSIPPSPELVAQDLARVAANDAACPDRSSELTARYLVKTSPDTVRSAHSSSFPASAVPSTGR